MMILDSLTSKMASWLSFWRWRARYWPPLAVKMLVMGAGVAGLQAIATARRLGAIVSATDVRAAAKEQVESLGASFVTVDEEAFPDWKSKHGKAKDASVADLADDSELRASVQEAVDEANKAVSKAEAIKSFRILGEDWSVDSGHLTPSLKVKRNVVLKDHARDVEALYASPKAG